MSAKVSSVSGGIVSVDRDITTVIDGIRFILLEKFDFNNDPSDNRTIVKIRSLLDTDPDAEPIEFTVYQSNSELGFWRLCYNKAGSRTMVKGDIDYVQGTLIHLSLQQFINNNIGMLPHVTGRICTYPAPQNREILDLINDPSRAVTNLMPFQTLYELDTTGPMNSRVGCGLMPSGYRSNKDQAVADALHNFSTEFRRIYRVVGYDKLFDTSFEFEQIIDARGEIMCIELTRNPLSREELDQLNTMERGIYEYLSEAHNVILSVEELKFLYAQRDYGWNTDPSPSSSPGSPQVLSQGPRKSRLRSPSTPDIEFSRITSYYFDHQGDFFANIKLYVVVTYLTQKPLASTPIWFKFNSIQGRQFQQAALTVCSKPVHIFPFFLTTSGVKINEYGIYTKFISAGIFICKMFDYADPAYNQCTETEETTLRCSKTYAYIGNRYNDVFPLNNLIVDVLSRTTCPVDDATMSAAAVSSGLGTGRIKKRKTKISKRMTMTKTTKRKKRNSKKRMI
jgi:hypothetical protein